jgi:spore coat polysaccharide biosynthesis protein SpsF
VRIIATIEARMSSSRLPGKVLLPVLGQPMLAHLARRAQAVPSLSGVIVATTTNASDDVLAQLAGDLRIGCFRGSEHDVLGRVLAAATAAAADVIVELTGDNPLIDPAIVETLVRTFLANEADYVSNTHVKSFPDGMDVQVFRRQTLASSAAMTNDPLEREHVTLHIRRHPQLFRPIHVMAPPELHWPELSVTLDERGDYELIQRVVERLGAADPLFGCREIIQLLRANPEWLELNRSVRRKGDS